MHFVELGLQSVQAPATQAVVQASPAATQLPDPSHLSGMFDEAPLHRTSLGLHVPAHWPSKHTNWHAFLSTRELPTAPQTCGVTPSALHCVSMSGLHVPHAPFTHKVALSASDSH